MTNQPLVSVIIPCYNYGRFLKRATDSVLTQTFQNFEIIICDDASSDNTAEIVHSILHNMNSQGPSIRYIRQESNVGQSKNRNTGISSARGQFIALLDADDWWDPRYLKTVMPAFNDPQVGCVYVLKQGWTENGEKCDAASNVVKSGWITADLLCENFVGTPVVFRRESIPDGGYETNLCPEYNNLGVDWWIGLQVSVNWKFVGIDSPLYNYYFHGNQMSSKNFNQRLLADQIIQERFFRLYPNVLTKQQTKEVRFWKYIREGFYLRETSDKWEAIYSYFKAIMIKPLSVISYKSLAHTLIRVN